MELWQDQGIVLSARPHGENGAVISVLTVHNGRRLGYVRGIHTQKIRGTLEPGSLVDARWQARTADSLGTFSLELSRGAAAPLLGEPLKLAALQSACALSDAAIPEREGGEGVFQGLKALLEMLDSDIWGEAYVMWEIALLREMGFPLALDRCAGGGESTDLAYVSPKTGRAVSKAAGEPYKERLLPLPGFLRPGSVGEDGKEGVLEGLKLTACFLEHWVFAHHTRGVPEFRRVFQQKIEKSLGFSDALTLNNAHG
ncbi:MAG: DNA repair protein RecO [Alphaproteobacteria bacterium]|nr:DNA repair protein RecO [Alphaproteobacteria bacterium]